LAQVQAGGRRHRASEAEKTGVLLSGGRGVRVTDVVLFDRVLLIGPPGIGKTEVVMQKAKEEAERLGRVFVDLRAASDEELDAILSEPGKYYVFYRIIAPHVFPEDLGVPRPVERGYVEFFPPKVLKVLTLPGIRGVLFIDEVTNVARDDQKSMLYSLIQEKEASWLLKLDQGVKVVMAGNTPEWSEIVSPPPIPLRSRWTPIRVAPPTAREWCEYMERLEEESKKKAEKGEGRVIKWDKAACAFLLFHEEKILVHPEKATDPDDVTGGYPTPRSWTELAIHLAELREMLERGEISEGVYEAMREQLVIGRLGTREGPYFLAWLKKGEELAPKIYALMERPEVWDEIRDPGDKAYVLYAIASKPLEELAKYRKFIGYLRARDRESYAVLSILARGKLFELGELEEHTAKIKEVIQEVVRSRIGSRLAGHQRITP